MNEHYFGREFTARAWNDLSRSLNRARLIQGRPKRDTVINEDDISNLKIALGIARSVDEFLRMI